MKCPIITLILFKAALLAGVSASYPAVDYGLQQQVLENEDEPTTCTTITTRTYYEVSMVTETRTSTRPVETILADATVVETTFETVLPPHPGENVGVQTWYAGQKKQGCDKAACSSCRWWYKCQSGEEAW
jgi:hypothetical protein